MAGEARRGLYRYEHFCGMKSLITYNETDYKPLTYKATLLHISEIEVESFVVRCAIL